MYYNTTHLTGDMLEEAKNLTSKQDQVVLNIFSSNPHTEFNSHEIEDKLEKYPRSSIVRSINTLTKRGLLRKTDNKVLGKYDKLVYTWILNLPGDPQMGMFNEAENSHLRQRTEW